MRLARKFHFWGPQEGWWTLKTPQRIKLLKLWCVMYKFTISLVYFMWEKGHVKKGVHLLAVGVSVMQAKNPTKWDSCWRNFSNKHRIKNFFCVYYRIVDALIDKGKFIFFSQHISCPQFGQANFYKLYKLLSGTLTKLFFCLWFDSTLLCEGATSTSTSKYNNKLFCRFFYL